MSHHQQQYQAAPLGPAQDPLMLLLSALSAAENGSSGRNGSSNSVAAAASAAAASLPMNAAAGSSTSVQQLSKEPQGAALLTYLNEAYDRAKSFAGNSGMRQAVPQVAALEVSQL
jgi:hypothetical protein